MRIAFYAPMKPPTHPVPSGDRRMARMLMAALAGAGHQVDLASRFRTWDAGTVPGRQARLSELGFKLAGRLTEHYLDRHANRRPHVWFTYHLYHKAPDWIGPVLADRLNIPYVVAEASYAAKQRKGRWAMGFKAAEVAMRRADRIIALSSADVPGLLDGPVPHNRLELLRPFVDTAPFARAATTRHAIRSTLASELGLSQDQPWLVVVGMMRAGDKEASYRMLAAALGRILDRPWNLIVVGDGPQEDVIKAVFAESVPEGRVVWTGALPPDDVARVLAAGDIMVWPAIREAYGMALLEAQSAGLPVVAGNVGGVPDIIVQDQTGLLTPDGDTNAFAAAIAHLLESPGNRRRMRAAALARTAAHHDIDQAGQFLDRTLRAVRTRYDGSGSSQGAIKS